jgi:hypothetical protein
MGAAWIDNSVGGSLDAMLEDIRTSANEIHLVTSFTPGETYATVIGRSIATTAINTGNFTGPVASGNDRILTFTGASATATNGSTGADLHMVIGDGSRLLAISDESTDQDVTNGNTINFGSFEIRALQPTSVA